MASNTAEVVIETWKTETARALKQRMAEELEDEDHVPNTLGNIEAFLNRWLGVIKVKNGQLEKMRKLLP
jgi:hypothetical protein